MISLPFWAACRSNSFAPLMEARWLKMSFAKDTTKTATTGMTAFCSTWIKAGSFSVILVASVKLDAFSDRSKDELANNLLTAAGKRELKRRGGEAAKNLKVFCINVQRFFRSFSRIN